MRVVSLTFKIYNLDMKYIDCIFTDLDGTLLDIKHQIMPKTKQILQIFYHNNVIIVPVSARMPATIIPIMDAICTNTPLIAYNGAYILNQNKEALLSLTIDEATSAAIYNFVKNAHPNACLCAYYKNDWITEDISDRRIQTEIKAVGISPKEFPLDQYICQTKKLHKLFIIIEPEKTDNLVMQINQKWNNIYACKSSDIFVEITSVNASKGNAIKIFAQKTSVSLADSIAFGDQINDIDMLDSVSVSVAMGNAVESVKSAAKYVTKTNNDEGIYEFLKNYIDEESDM